MLLWEKKQKVLVAATLPGAGLRSLKAYVSKTFPHDIRVTMKLHGEMVMIFLNSVDDVDGATNALRKAGIEAVPYHAKLPLGDRVTNLDRFRRFRATTANPSHHTSRPTNESSSTSSSTSSSSVPVLVCTDLAARGLDVSGVTAVVQLQFAGNVVAHLHRMGRCGRAGKRDGRGIVFYGLDERESSLVDVVREAEANQQTMALEGAQLVEDDNDEDNDNNNLNKDGTPRNKGKLDSAFSRKRGFTKKRKKMQRRRNQEN
mmetsp:Transcript_11490/g.16246  ORF Transcript_11490/g.16246 Transcript_11490/m.16246 type:complete len:259 (+) Transcript_11490:150-926(+)